MPLTVSFVARETVLSKSQIGVAGTRVYTYGLQYVISPTEKDRPIAICFIALLIICKCYVVWTSLCPRQQSQHH